MHPHWQKKGGGVAVKNMALGARFQKLRGDLLSGGGSILRSAGGGAKFAEGASFSRASCHVFLQTCFFCCNIVINYSCHYVYSSIFDLAEFLTQNDHGPI